MAAKQRHEEALEESREKLICELHGLQDLKAKSPADPGRVALPFLRLFPGCPADFLGAFGFEGREGTGGSGSTSLADASQGTARLM